MEILGRGQSVGGDGGILCGFLHDFSEGGRVLGPDWLGDVGDCGDEDGGNVFQWREGIMSCGAVLSWSVAWAEMLLSVGVVTITVVVVILCGGQAWGELGTDIL